MHRSTIISFKNTINSWWFKVTFLGWLSDPFKGLSDLQLGDEKGTLNHLEFMDIQTSTHRLYRIDIKFTYKISSKTSNTQTLSISDSFFASARRSSCCKSSEKKRADAAFSSQPLLGSAILLVLELQWKLGEWWYFIIFHLHPKSWKHHFTSSFTHDDIHIIRYHSISFASASVEKQKKKSSCFCPPNLWVGNLRICVRCTKKNGTSESNCKSWRPYRITLEGKQLHLFWMGKNNSHFFSLHPTRSTLIFNLPSKSSDTALEKVRMESRLWMSNGSVGLRVQHYSHSTTFGHGFLDFGGFSLPQKKMAIAVAATRAT